MWFWRQSSSASNTHRFRCESYAHSGHLPCGITSVFDDHGVVINLKTAEFITKFLDEFSPLDGAFSEGIEIVRHGGDLFPAVATGTGMFACASVRTNAPRDDAGYVQT